MFILLGYIEATHIILPYLYNFRIRINFSPPVEIRDNCISLKHLHKFILLAFRLTYLLHGAGSFLRS